MGLPNAPVVQLSAAANLPATASTIGLLRAATYGRGIWQIPLLTAAPPTGAQISMTPATLAFAAQVVGSVSAPQGITVTNSGNASLLITSLTTTGAFVETDNCAGVPLAPGASCSAQIAFNALTTGPSSGALTLYANVAGGQATAALTGIAVAPYAVVLSPLSLDFGLVTLGQTTAAQNIAVQNTGGVTASLQPPVITGDFQISANTCGGSLSPGVSCNVAIVFAPVATGTRNGSLSIADSAGTQLASLTGRGASVATDTLSPTSLIFAPQLTGTSSAVQTVVLTNSGDTAITSIGVQTTAGFTVTSACGSALDGHATCSMQVAFAPTIAGQQTGTLTVSDQFRSQTIALSGKGLQPPTLQLSPVSLSFAPIAAGLSSPTQAIAISNSGSGQLSVASIAVTGYFTETDNCAGRIISVTNICTAQVTFSPTAAGSSPGLFTVVGSAPGQQATASLNGTALVPADIVLTPVSLSFGTVTLGQTSPAQNIAVSNIGGVSTPLSVPVISGPFTYSAHTCINSLAPSTGCTYAIVFKPTASGDISGTFSISDSAGTQTVTLTGTGASVATDDLSPSSLTFAPQQMGTSSASQTVTLTNTGDNALTLIAAQITGGNFTAASACGAALPGHSSCTISVSSTPAVNGPTSGSLIVSDQFRSQTIALSGIGFAPPSLALSPSPISFTGIAVGQSSATQTIQISNSGGGQLTVTSVAVSGDFTETDACAGKSLTSGVACTIQLTFSPTAAT